MSQTAFADLTLAAKRLLLQEPPLAGGRVRRGMPRPLQLGQPEAVVVLPAVAQALDAQTGGPQDWETTLVVELQCRGAPGQEPEDALDVLLAQVFERLQGLEAAAPAALESMRAPRVEWDLADAETPVATARLAFSVRHRVQAQTLRAAA